MLSPFWALDHEDGKWGTLPASPFLIPAFLIYVSLGLFYQVKEREQLYQRLNTGLGKQLGIRRVEIRQLLEYETLDDDTIRVLKHELLSIDKRFQTLI